MISLAFLKFSDEKTKLHTTSLVKYPVFDKGKNYSGANILKKKILLDFIEKNFLEELKTLKKSIIIPLGNTFSSTIEYLNFTFIFPFSTSENMFLRTFLKISGWSVMKFTRNKKSEFPP